MADQDPDEMGRRIARELMLTRSSAQNLSLRWGKRKRHPRPLRAERTA